MNAQRTIIGFPTVRLCLMIVLYSVIALLVVAFGWQSIMDFSLIPTIVVLTVCSFLLFYCYRAFKLVTWVKVDTNQLTIYKPFLLQKKQISFSEINKVYMNEKSPNLLRHSFDYLNLNIAFGEKEISVSTYEIYNFNKITSYLYETLDAKVLDKKSRDELLRTKEHFDLFNFFGLSVLGIMGWSFASWEIYNEESLYWPIVIICISSFLLFYYPLKFIKVLNQRYKG